MSHHLLRRENRAGKQNLAYTVDLHTRHHDLVIYGIRQLKEPDRLRENGKNLRKSRSPVLSIAVNDQAILTSPNSF